MFGSNVLFFGKLHINIRRCKVYVYNETAIQT